MNQPINADCLKTYRAVHNSGKRPIAGIKWIILHDEEADTAESSASWFTNPKSGGSVQLCVDANVCYRCLENDEQPWGAAGNNADDSLDANRNGFHIEQAGYARWSAVIWKSHLGTLQRAAFKTAYHCHLFNIPPTFVDYKKLRVGVKGITTHAQVTKAWPDVAALYGSHSDPGPFWPTWFFMWYVAKYYKQLGSNMAQRVPELGGETRTDQ